MQAKPWQIAVIVLAAVVLVASIVYQTMGRGDVRLSNELPMADVETGQIYLVARGKEQSLPVPFTLPGTSKATLWPAGQEGGKWLIERRFLELMPQDAGSAVDKSTGEVKTPDGKPVKISA